MNPRSHAARSFTAAAVVAAAVALTVGCGNEAKDLTEGQSSRPEAASAATTPTEIPVAPRRPPNRIDKRTAAAGRIQVEDGPFTDRVKTSNLRLQGAKRPHLSGQLLNLTDVSEVLLLELRADFYDRSGRYLGSGQQTFEEAEAFSDTALRFTINGGKQPRPATAAILTVPQLVNE